MDCEEFKEISNKARSHVSHSKLVEHRLHYLECKRCGKGLGIIKSIDCTQYNEFTKSTLSEEAGIPGEMFDEIRHICEKHLIECSFCGRDH